MKKILFLVLFFITTVIIIGLPTVIVQAGPSIYNGDSCSDDEQCYSGNCYNNICCRPSAVCCSNDSQCPSDAYCSSSEYYCIYQFEDGDYCERDRQCQSNKCLNNHCSASSSCGDGVCDSGESCSSCAMDCGSCQKSNGYSCSKNSGCKSNNCFNGICCADGHTCCQNDSQCSTDEFCSTTAYYCYPKMSGGAYCTRDAICQSGSCLNNKCGSITYCGDDLCNGSETCSNCSSDCGSCLKANGGSCAQASECASGYCVHRICRSNYIFCGDDHCDSGETCSNCAEDCGSCERGQAGAACNSNSDCDSNNCGHNICCKSGSICCDDDKDCGSADSYCTGSPYYVCAVKWDDGTSCSNARYCKGGHCLDGKCYSKGHYCGDGACDSDENCTNCWHDCGQCPTPPEPAKSPDLKFHLQTQNIELIKGASRTLWLNLENIGNGIAENVSFEILVDHPEFVEAAPISQTIGSIESNSQKSEEIKIISKQSGTAYLAFNIRADNQASIMKFVRIKVEPGIALSVPESLYLLPNENYGFNIFLTNPGNELVKVQTLSMEILDTSVVGFIQNPNSSMVLNVRGQGDGIKPDEVLETGPEDILRGIFPEPEIKSLSRGETELIFKVGYFFPQSIHQQIETSEQRVRIKVGQLSGGKKSILDFKIIPSFISVERSEAREVKLVLKNQGSLTIRQGKINISKSEQSPFEATEEVWFGSIEPGQRAAATIEIVGHPQLSAQLEEQARRGGELIVTSILSFTGEYEILDGRQLSFKDEMKVSLVEQREKCAQGDQDCQKAVKCLIELSSSMNCALEFADIIPYLDKPIAVVLATSDVCEINSRIQSGDKIGAALSTILFASDLADNLGEAVPGAGNLAAGFADIVEGAADCAEGFVYEAVNEYCPGRFNQGYQGCAEKIFDALALNSYQYKEPRAARKFAVAVAASPVSIKVVDNNGAELTGKDGVLVFQIEDLKLAFIKNPQNLSSGFNFEISGWDNGTYNLYLGLIDDGKVVRTRELKDQPISQDESISVPLLVKTSGARLTDFLVGEKEIAKARKGSLPINWQLLKTILYIVLPVLVAFLIGRIIWRRIRPKKKTIQK